MWPEVNKKATIIIVRNVSRALELRRGGVFAKESVTCLSFQSTLCIAQCATLAKIQPAAPKTQTTNVFLVQAQHLHVTCHTLTCCKNKTTNDIHQPTWLAVRMMKLILQKGTNRLGKKKTASPKILKVVACFAVSWGLRLKESVSCGNQDSCARLVRPDIHHHLHLNCARLQRCIRT